MNGPVGEPLALVPESRPACLLEWPSPRAVKAGPTEGQSLFKTGGFGQQAALDRGSSALPLPHAGPLPTVPPFHQALLTGSRFGLCLQP